jgi:methyl-accepting chemotaxis protein
MLNFILHSIRYKLLALTGLGTTLVVAASIFGLYQGWSAIMSCETLMTNDIQSAQQIVGLQLGFSEQRRQWSNMLLRGQNESDRVRHWEQVVELQESIMQGVEELTSQLQHPGVVELLKQFEAAQEDGYKALIDASDFYLQLGSAETADAMVIIVLQDNASLLQQAVDLLVQNVATESTSVSAAARSLMLWSVVALVIAVLVAFVLFLILVERGIIRPAGYLVRELERMAQGDFSHPIRQLTRDELGRIAASAQGLQSQLGQALKQVSNAVAQVASASEEVAVISEQTNQGVSQQRQETNQIATAMHEMAATVQEVARNAAEAARAAEQADESSRSGAEVVRATVETVQEVAVGVEQVAASLQRLEQDSTAIGTVLDVIRGVAEQTNLLALNAAIEAARAGEQGRGFAVVADEVRTLALRSQQSTQEIQKIVERIQAGTADTVRVMDISRNRAGGAVSEAELAGEALETIAQAVGTIRDMNVQIASAAEQQSAVAEEMNRNITSFADVADQTADGAAQSTRAGEELARLASDLQTVVRQFKVG